MSTETGTSKRAREGGDGRDDPVHLLFLGDLGARTGFHAADVEHVATGGHEVVGPAQQRLELERGALVVEGVGRPVEDAHHEGALAHVVDAGANGQAGRHHVVGNLSAAAVDAHR